jgi:hypothetical protein
MSEDRDAEFLRMADERGLLAEVKALLESRNKKRRGRGQPPKELSDDEYSLLLNIAFHMRIFGCKASKALRAVAGIKSSDRRYHLYTQRYLAHASEVEAFLDQMVRPATEADLIDIPEPTFDGYELMKSGREHPVSLSDADIEILDQMQATMKQRP